MSRTGDNIYQRKDGRWEGRYYKGRKLNGSIKYGYIYRKTKKETKRVLDLLKSMYAPKVTETSYSADLKFKEWLPRWMERIQSQVKPSTYSNYRYKLTKYIIPYFGQMTLSKISEEEIYSYLNELEKNDLSAGSIHSIFTLFKQCLRAAISQFGGATSYLDAIKLPKRNRKKVGALSMVEQKRLTGVAQKAPRLEQEIEKLEKIDTEEFKELKSALIEVLEKTIDSLRFRRVEKFIEEKNALTEAKMAGLENIIEGLNKQVIRLEDSQKKLDTQLISTSHLSIEQQFEKQSNKLKKVFKRNRICDGIALYICLADTNFRTGWICFTNQ